MIRKISREELNDPKREIGVRVYVTDANPRRLKSAIQRLSTVKKGECIGMAYVDVHSEGNNRFEVEYHDIHTQRTGPTLFRVVDKQVWEYCGHGMGPFFSLEDSLSSVGIKYVKRRVDMPQGDLKGSKRPEPVLVS